MPELGPIDRYVRLTSQLHLSGNVAKIAERAGAIAKVLNGESPDAAVIGLKIARHRLQIWIQTIREHGLYAWLKVDEPDDRKLRRAGSGIAQMLLGKLAEDHFVSLSAGLLSAKGYRVEDERVGRTDTDFKIIDPNGHPVCRFNIKFHCTLFREAQDYVGLDPTDCFALATYKIHGALK
jgi:hypothetical protein